MENILLTIHLIIAVVLVVVILLQKSEGGALGIGGGGGSNQFGLFTARGSANFLTRTTAILATLFIMSSLLLTVVGRDSAENQLLEQLESDGVEIPLVTPLEEIELVPNAGDADANADDSAIPLAQ
ncbi:MAG: preprotein translocase subunit SecG [Alphaproteobacteria bacterium]|nr:preprotein translocase subunit SecG [Alphaproteobacteria bacterium]